MDRPELIVALFAFTLIAVLAIAIWQKARVRRAQERRGEPVGAAAIDASTADHLRDGRR